MMMKGRKSKYLYERKECAFVLGSQLLYFAFGHLVVGK